MMATAREIIDNQNELINLLREKLEAQEKATEEGYRLAMHIAHVMMPDSFHSFSPNMGCGVYNAELMFERLLVQTGKKTTYQFKSREDTYDVTEKK